MLLLVINKSWEAILYGRNKQSFENTKQRKYMLELLKSTKQHPNAFWTYENMLGAFPRLSLSTVYRNLGILESQGLVQPLSCSGSFDGYDADISVHSHFYCKECRKMYDVGLHLKKMAVSNIECGRHRTSFSKSFIGTCMQCLS